MSLPNNPEEIDFGSKYICAVELEEKNMKKIETNNIKVLRPWLWRC